MRYTLGYVRSFSSKKYRFGTKKCVCAASQSRLRLAGGSVRRSLLRRTRVFAGGGIGNALNGFGLAFASGTNEKTCTEPLLFRAQFFFVSFCALHALVLAHAKGPPVSERTAPVWCLRNGLAGAALLMASEAAPSATSSQAWLRCDFGNDSACGSPACAPKGLYATFGASSARAMAFS